ncbi:hypothetical protein PR048_008560 [Dryococelus australis]|uniref:Uncharacterized protein n=1 Tax=Dryococelus australis TaxID=614101 RepID=A0ABQ9HXG6_9NEOP|nr:hypothetical protein PR048_008560 [Dryococelus australis]
MLLLSSSEVEASLAASTSTLQLIIQHTVVDGRVRFVNSGSDLHRDFHSTPDLAQTGMDLSNGAVDFRVPKGHRSQEDVAALMLLSGGVVVGRPPLPPPTHPPPPPPTMGQLVKVDISRGSVKPSGTNGNCGSEYANMGAVKVEGPGSINNSPGTVDSAQIGVMSSFKPSNSAKLYASPEDMKTVGYRSRSLPAHSSRPQVRKSHSLRSSASSFKPSLQQAATADSTQVQSPYTINVNNNPYAQPIRSAMRSHSMIAGTRESLKLKNKKSGIPASSSAANLSSVSSPPPIPDPDYSLSESDGEGVTRTHNSSVVETSGNSNTSGGSSSSSSTIPHSFSVEEIQKVRTQLKSSKSYPNDFLAINHGNGEDGDNSSSGVSSDQDLPVGPPCGFDDGRSSEGSGGSEGQLEVGKGRRLTQTTGGGGMLTRHAVSLAQLPPPLEGEGEGDGELVVPPPPEFLGAPGAAGTVATEEVLAPPPQFCDNRLVTRVRIVGALPKPGPNTGGRLHSQVGQKTNSVWAVTVGFNIGAWRDVDQYKQNPNYNPNVIKGYSQTTWWKPLVSDEDPGVAGWRCLKRLKAWVGAGPPELLASQSSAGPSVVTGAGELTLSNLAARLCSHHFNHCRGLGWASWHSEGCGELVPPLGGGACNVTCMNHGFLSGVVLGANTSCPCALGEAVTFQHAACILTAAQNSNCALCLAGAAKIFRKFQIFPGQLTGVSYPGDLGVK